MSVAPPNMVVDTTSNTLVVFAKLLEEFSANIINTDFAGNVKLRFSVKQNLQDYLQERLTDLSGGKYTLKFIESKFDKA